MRPLTAIAALGLAGVMTTSACGSSHRTASSGTPTTIATTNGATPISKGEWLAKAQKLCDRYNSEIGAIGGGAHDPASRNAAGAAIVRLIGKHSAEARALGYPPGDRATLEPIWNGLDAAVAELERTGPHPNVEADVGKVLGPWVAKLQAYGSC